MEEVMVEASVVQIVFSLRVSLVAPWLSLQDHRLEGDDCYVFFFFFPYIQCPFRALNSHTTHVKTGSLHTVGKPLLDFPTSFYTCRVGHHFLISHAPSSFPMLCYLPIRLPGSAPMAYL